jgi:hypothetical protein
MLQVCVHGEMMLRVDGDRSMRSLQCSQNQSTIEFRSLLTFVLSLYPLRNTSLRKEGIEDSRSRRTIEPRNKYIHTIIVQAKDAAPRIFGVAKYFSLRRPAGRRNMAFCGYLLTLLKFVQQNRISMRNPLCSQTPTKIIERKKGEQERKFKWISCPE